MDFLIFGGQPTRWKSIISKSVAPKIKAFEFKWNPKKKNRVTKAVTNRYPDAEVETITPENFGEWVG